MLESYLKEQFGIEKNERLKSPMSGNSFLLADLLKVLQKRKTEGNIIRNIEDHKMTDKKRVLSFLTGIADRFVMENLL